jgi:hypothetical protein
MNLQWILLLGFAFALGSVACGLIAAGYKWGRFAALQSLRSGSGKWKAYLVGLFPPLIFALTLGTRNSFASPELIFLWVGLPSAIGTRIRYHAGLE